MSAAQPGWYADPSGQAGLRWWDGQGWTAATREATPAPPPQGSPFAPPPAASTPAPPPATSPFQAPASSTPTAPIFPTATTAPTEPIAAVPPSAPPTRSPGSFGDWSAGQTTNEPPTTDPGPPFAAASFASPASPPPPAPPSPPPAAPPFSSSPNYSPSGYSPPGYVPPASTPPAGLLAADARVPAGADGLPPETPSRGNWVGWAAAGAGVAVIIVLVVFLAASVLGSSTSPPSSQGLSSGTTPTTSGSTSSTSSTEPPTDPTTTPTTDPSGGGAPGAPAGSVLYTDPGGAYSVSVGADWQRSTATISGIPMWVIESSGTGGRSVFEVVAESLPESTSLAQVTQGALQGMEQYKGFHLVSTTTITLDDGDPATVVRYSSQQASGLVVQGEAVIAASASNAVIETVAAPTASAAGVFATADPYLRTLQVN